MSWNVAKVSVGGDNSAAVACNIRVSNAGKFIWAPLQSPHLEHSMDLRANCQISDESSGNRIHLRSPSLALSIQLPSHKHMTIWVASISGAARKSEAIAEYTKCVHTLCGVRFELDAHYKPLKALGRGTFGFVISALDRRTGCPVAIKKVQNTLRDRTDAKRLLRELQVLRHLKHPNIMSIEDVLVPSSEEQGTFDDLYFATGLMETDLDRVLKSKQSLGLSHISTILYQLFCGLKYMHSAGVIHRDLKPANILANGDCSIKICDFGLCREQDGGPLSVSVVTRWYRAPEVLLGLDDYGPAIDMWGAGLVLAEMLHRQPLLPGSSSLDQMARILSLLGTPAEQQLRFLDGKADAQRFMRMQPQQPGTPWATLFPDAPPLLLDLLSRLLVFNPRQRLSAAQALEHPLFARLRSPQREAHSRSRFRFAHTYNVDLTRAELRRLLREEAMEFQRRRQRQSPPRPDGSGSGSSVRNQCAAAAAAGAGTTQNDAGRGSCLAATAPTTARREVAAAGDDTIHAAATAAAAAAAATAAAAAAASTSPPKTSRRHRRRGSMPHERSTAPADTTYAAAVAAVAAAAAPPASTSRAQAAAAVEAAPTTFVAQTVTPISGTKSTPVLPRLGQSTTVLPAVRTARGATTVDRTRSLGQSRKVSANGTGRADGIAAQYQHD